jgi:alkylation response protein AidB-like acyl-CoA dehydrogenase
MTAGFDLGLTTRQQSMKDNLHAVARGYLRARAADAERDGVNLCELRDHVDRLGLAPNEIVVAPDTEPHTLLVALEELAYGDPAHAYALVPLLQVATIVAACGTAEQRRLVAEALAAPAATASVLLYEDFGRQPSELATSVHRDTHGWVAAGHKTSVANPADADVTLLVARDGDEPVAFVGTGPRQGLEVVREDRASGKIGLSGVPTGAVRLTAATFTDSERLSDGPTLDQAIGQARLLIAAVLVGTARATIEFCAGYAVHRTAFGKPLAEYQAVSMPLIDHHTEIDEVRLLIWDVAAQLGQLEDRSTIERKVGRAVSRAGSLGLRATRDGVQLIGVRAITRDLPSERWYRDAAALATIDFDILQIPFGLS